jgi:DNA-binding CsgD family transcriptional regulator
LQGKLNLAEVNLLEALDLAIQVYNADYLLSIYGSLSEVYKEKNENEKALFYVEMEISLRDSLLENERLNSMIFSEAQFKTQFFKDSLDQAKIDLVNKDRDISASDGSLKSAIWAIYLLIPLVLILGIIYFRKRKRSQILSEDVQMKETSIQSLNKQAQRREEIIESIEKTTKKPYPENLEALTEREKQSLTLLAEGMSDQDISASMYLSPATIRTHLRKSYAKIDVKNRAQATQFVLAHHL